MTAPIPDVAFALSIADNPRGICPEYMRVALQILGDAYRQTARREAVRVRVTPETAAQLSTVANALRKALLAYREWQAKPTPERKARAQRKAELYEIHRQRAYKVEMARRLHEVLHGIESQFVPWREAAKARRAAA